MVRIDANLAAQVADTTRPIQTTRDGENQAVEARRIEAAAAEPGLSAKVASADELKAAAERLQSVIETATGRKLQFSVNDRFNEMIVRISDRNSGELLKEIPSQDFMKLRERLDDLLGLFVNEKA